MQVKKTIASKASHEYIPLLSLQGLKRNHFLRTQDEMMDQFIVLIVMKDDASS